MQTAAGQCRYNWFKELTLMGVIKDFEIVTGNFPSNATMYITNDTKISKNYASTYTELKFKHLNVSDNLLIRHYCIHRQSS